jgi:hypothetical protein
MTARSLVEVTDVTVERTAPIYSKQLAGNRVANSSGVKMEAARVSETSVNFNRIHGVTARKAVLLVVANERTSSHLEFSLFF